MTENKKNVPVVMDGSMGRQLCIDGMPEDDLFRQVWSARALVDSSLHKLVVETHQKYIAAGAKIITTNNYGVQPTYYQAAFGKDNWQKLVVRDTKLAVELACQAKKLEGDDGVRVFGCLPPLVESHRPDLFTKFIAEHGEDCIKDSYRLIVKALVDAGVDGLIPETMNNAKEALLALEVCVEVSPTTPIILCMEAAFRSETMKPQGGEIAAAVVGEVFDAAVNVKANLEAIGLNCAPPEDVLNSLACISADTSLVQSLADNKVALAVYANHNDLKEVYDTGFDVNEIQKDINARQDLQGRAFTETARKFVEHGATYVGGCCGCGPETIAALAHNLC